MISNLAKQLMGEATVTGDVPPVMTASAAISNPQATGAKRKIPTEDPSKSRKVRNRIVDRMMGHLKEDRDGSVIPSDAEEVTSIEQSENGLKIQAPEVPGQKIKNPYSGEEPLILPAASLVAPDVTPEGIFPLDPSQVPGADRGHAPQAAAPQPPLATGPTNADTPTVDLLLGKPPTGPVPTVAGTPQLSTESALSMLPGIPSTSAAVAGAGISGDALLSVNQPMPEHKPSGIGNILETFRRFGPRSASGK